MIRKRFEWHVGRSSFVLGERTFLSGVLDLGADYDPDRAFVRASALAETGADFIEVGHEPSLLLSEAEELRRLVPVLKRLKGAIDRPVSVMTSKSAVAAKAVEHGASILHDPSGLTADADLARIAAGADSGLILSHMHGSPETWARLGSFTDPAGVALVELDASLGRAIRAGVLRKRIAIDPGFDFGKRKEQNIDLLTGLDRLAALGLPLHIAPSQRAWLPPTIEVQPDHVMLAALTAGVLRGAHIVRVHNVAAARAAAALADQLLLAIPEEAPPPPRRPRPSGPPSADPPRPRPVRPPQRWHRGQK